MNNRTLILTSIYSNLWGTEFGGRPSREYHYKVSLLNILNLSPDKVICYTSEDEINSLKQFFYNERGVSESLIEFIVFDLKNTRYFDKINSIKDLEFMKTRATKTHRLLGGNSNAFDAFLLINGMKTLEVRMQRHGDNAMKVAEFLTDHPGIATVNYNGLSTHPDFAVSSKQMRHPGAMMSFELNGGYDAGVQFMNKLQLCTRTVSLGTCDTLLSHPASMSHSSVPRESRLEYGITDGLIRLSVGMENIEDILDDFVQALGA